MEKDIKEFLEQHFNHTVENYEFTKEDMDKLIDMFKGGNGSKTFTENGLKIFECMKENEQKYINVFKAKEIGELLFMTPRSVSGSMKKLIADGFVEKVGANPVAYGLTELGKAYEFDKE
jgi:hypothetical protein